MAAAYTALFDSPDQEKVVSDLTTFFGPNSGGYIKLYEKMQRPGGKRSLMLSVNWWVFLTSFVWFFYRKQYIMGALALLVPVVVSMLLDNVGAGAYVMFALMANELYMQSALKRVAKADELGLDGDARTEYLRKAGGVSKIAGGIALFFFIGILGLMILNARTAGGLG